MASCPVSTKHFFFDLVLPLAEKTFQGYNLYLLWTGNHLNWFAVTVAILLLPGIMELAYWTIECCRGAASNSKIWEGRGENESDHIPFSRKENASR